MNELKFTVTVDEANILLTGLGELPAKMSMGLIGKLQEQAKGQVNQEAESPVGKVFEPEVV